MRVGFIGLGIMGSRMARNLLAQKVDVTVYNRTPEKADPIISAGAKWAKTPADVARNVDVLFTMAWLPVSTLFHG